MSVFLASVLRCWQADLVLCGLYVFGSLWHIQSGASGHRAEEDSVDSGVQRFLDTCRLLIALRFLTLSRRVRAEMLITWKIR